MDEFEREPPLGMYLSYDYLPIEQQSRILSSINGVYSTIIESQRPFWPKIEGVLFVREYEDYPYLGPYLSPPLCIVSAYTGNSIKFKFDIERKFLPRIVPQGEDIKIFVPRWTAAVVLTGAMLTGGLHAYGEYLNIQKTSLEIDKIQIELQELKTKSLKDEKSPLHNQLNIHLNQFHHEINQINIKHAEINNVSIKESRNYYESE